MKAFWRYFRRELSLWEVSSILFSLSLLIYFYSQNQDIWLPSGMLITTLGMCLSAAISYWRLDKQREVSVTNKIKSLWWYFRNDFGLFEVIMTLTMLGLAGYSYLQKIDLWWLGLTLCASMPTLCLIHALIIKRLDKLEANLQESEMINDENEESGR